jgi:carbon-monoxide dehydrogenase medium subunit
LPTAAATIGHLAIRERGTVGGSLALADPAAQWPLMARLFNARIDLATVSGTRSVSHELLVAVAFPQLHAGEGWGYRAFARRHGDFAIVAAAVTTVLTTSGAVERMRLALGGIGSAPLVLHELAAAWTGRTINAAAMHEIGHSAAAAVEPQDDLQASAQFRRELVAVLTADALADALGCSRR